MRIKYLKNIAIYFIIAMFFVTDIFLKQLSLNFNYDQRVSLVGKWLEFYFVPNPYISFSLPLSGWLLETFITLLIVALIFIIIKIISRSKQYIEYLPPLVMITLGATSNLVDRLHLGYVIDYLNLEYFTVFNLADALITLGAIWIIGLSFKKEKK